MNYDFRFKQFGINHDACAMKVGTDGVLLGAWAATGKHIVDIGTGSGVVAMMMAQRRNDAHICAIEVDGAAARQAAENVETSPFAGRIDVIHADAREWFAAKRSAGAQWEAMVCNPPFYNTSLNCGTQQRNMARQAEYLTLNDLFTIAAGGLTENGQLSMVLPIERWREAETALAQHGLFVHRLCKVATKEGKPPKRVLMAVGRTACHCPEHTEEVLTDREGKRSVWYDKLTEESYL